MGTCGEDELRGVGERDGYEGGEGGDGVQAVAEVSPEREGSVGRESAEDEGGFDGGYGVELGALGHSFRTKQLEKVK